MYLANGKSNAYLLTCYLTYFSLYLYHNSEYLAYLTISTTGNVQDNFLKILWRFELKGKPF